MTTTNKINEITRGELILIVHNLDVLRGEGLKEAAQGRPVPGRDDPIEQRVQGHVHQHHLDVLRFQFLY